MASIIVPFAGGYMKHDEKPVFLSVEQTTPEK